MIVYFVTCCVISYCLGLPNLYRQGNKKRTEFINYSKQGEGQVKRFGAFLMVLYCWLLLKVFLTWAKCPRGALGVANILECF